MSLGTILFDKFSSLPAGTRVMLTRPLKKEELDELSLIGDYSDELFFIEGVFFTKEQLPQIKEDVCIKSGSRLL